MRAADLSGSVVEEELAGWVAACAGGDPVAFTRVYQACSGPVLGYLVGLVKDGALAEDVTQETFLALWCTAGRFDPAKGKVLTWLLTIARCKAVDRLRAAAARSRRERGYDDAERVTSSGTTVGQALSNLEGAQVRAAMQVLTPRQRATVEMAYYRGLTYKQIGFELGVPLDTAKTRARDSMIRLRGALTDQVSHGLEALG